MKKKRKSVGAKKIWQMLMLVLLLIGFGIALYPFYVGAVNNFIDQYRLQKVTKLNDKNTQEMKEKNARLAALGIHISRDPFKGGSKKEKVLLKQHLIGSVTVPKIKLHVPLFDKTSDDLLEYGVTVVQGTSYPIGGKSTHTVIAGHRGLASRKLFTDLNHVKKDNIFVIKVGNKNRAYKVNRIRVVKPNNTEVLKIEPGKDLATLLTCTPYMINSHRLLVTGYRVPYTKNIAKKAARASNENNYKQFLILLGIVLLFATLLIMLFKTIHSFLLKKNRFDFDFILLNEDGNLVKNVKIKLLTKSGTKNVYRNGVEYVAVSDQDGRVHFADLPGGLYAIKPSARSRVKYKFGLKKLKQKEACFYPRKKQREIYQNGNEWRARLIK